MGSWPLSQHDHRLQPLVLCYTPFSLTKAYPEKDEKLQKAPLLPPPKPPPPPAFFIPPKGLSVGPLAPVLQLSLVAALKRGGGKNQKKNLDAPSSPPYISTLPTQRCPQGSRGRRKKSFEEAGGKGEKAFKKWAAPSHPPPTLPPPPHIFLAKKDGLFLGVAESVV